MKITKIDSLGRVVIPIEYRKALHLTPNTALTFERAEEGVRILPLEKRCRLCEAVIDTTRPFPLCDICIEKIKKE